MFKELAPYLRQRAVLLTVSRLEEDQISVNVIPQKTWARTLSIRDSGIPRQ